ncbi:MAG: methyltransferase domain-containing protein [Acidobacteriia bacterium]|nr:methyltransferase domain-containing protein [Terriglobia bacterium]
MLDVGSGVGSFVVARRRGLQAFGIEPDRIGQGGRLSAIEIASRRQPEGVFAVAEGESLPFADQSFDFVTLNQVIEHVSNQRAVLREAARVLKHGGTLYVACPNYLRFYEPHYKIFWLPLLPKLLGRLYLRCRGRNPVLLDQLTYTTNSRLRRLLQELGEEYALIDTHQHQFLKKCAAGSFASGRARTIGRLTRLPVFGPLIRRAALLFLRVTEGGCEMLVQRKASAAGGLC